MVKKGPSRCILALGGKEPAPVAALLGEFGNVAAAPAIARALLADGAFAAPQGAGDGAQAFPLLQPQGNALAFALTQLLMDLLGHVGLNC